jgi:predicted aspartyl protease
MRRTNARLAPLLILGLILLLGGCSLFLPKLTPARTQLGGPRVEVPLRIVDAIPLVEARVGGGAPHWFVVDSGAAACTISPRLAAQLSARAASGSASATDGIHDATLATVRLPDVEIGGARFDDVFAIVLDLGDIEARFGVELGGILGFPLFSELTWTIDYAGQRLVLERSALPRPNGRDVVAMEIDDARHPAITVNLAGRDEAFAIDTGSDSVFDVPTASAARLSLRAGPVDYPAARLAFGASPHRAARLAGTATIGRFRFEDPMLSLMGSDRQAIGGKTLAGFAITFDPRHGAVRLARPGAIVNMPSKRTLGARLEKRAGAWRVTELIRTPGAPPSPLARGDEIVSVEGQPAAPFDEESFTRLVAKSDALHLEILRAGQPIAITAPVTTLVP